MDWVKLKLLGGFTIIELLIVIAILGILYAVALPNYTTYIQQSRRIDIQQLILQQITVLERQYTRVGGYPHTYQFPSSDYYTFSYQSNATQGKSDGSKFKIIAVPKGSQGSDVCGTLEVDQSGNKKPEDDKCW